MILGLFENALMIITITCNEKEIAGVWPVLIASVIIFPRAAVSHTHFRGNEKCCKRMIFAETSHMVLALYGHAFEAREFMHTHSFAYRRVTEHSRRLERCQSSVCSFVIRRLSWSENILCGICPIRGI